MQRRSLILISILAVLIIALGVFWFMNRTHDCVVAKERRVVQGDSLTGVLGDGSEIAILKGYYKCHFVERNDLVVYNYPDAPDPLIKIVKALPGDSFALKPNLDGTWTIYVNGMPLVSPRGGYYLVSSQEYRRFHLYEMDYGTHLPDGVYMLLGTDPRDSFDSRVFGLANIVDFIGKAEVLQNKS